MDIIIQSLPRLLEGTVVTVYISLLVIIISTVIGIVLGVLISIGNRLMRGVINTYVYVIRGTPALVQLFLFFFGLPFFGIFAPPVAAGTVALSAYAGAFNTETVRGGILSVPKGQVEGGLALGMRRLDVMRYVILPQSIKYAIPPYILMVARIIRLTSLLSIINIVDLTLVAREIVQRTLLPFHIFSVAMVIYFLLSYPLVRLSYRLEERFTYEH